MDCLKRHTNRKRGLNRLKWFSTKNTPKETSYGYITVNCRKRKESMLWFFGRKNQGREQETDWINLCRWSKSVFGEDGFHFKLQSTTFDNISLYSGIRYRTPHFRLAFFGMSAFFFDGLESFKWPVVRTWVIIKSCGLPKKAYK